MQQDIYAAACLDSAYAHMIEGAKKRNRLYEDAHSRFFVEGSRKLISTLYGALPGLQEKVLEAGNQGCTGFAIARSMMMDDMICRVKPVQVVLLGGGYACRESVIYRKLKRVNVFALERPDILAKKQAGLEKISRRLAKKNDTLAFTLHEHTRYLPYDGQTDIWQTLCEAGLDAAAKTLVISEMYLALLERSKAEQILHTLCQHLPQHSHICFDFICGPTEQGVQGYVMFSGAKEQGEYIKPVDTQKFMKAYDVSKAVIRSGRYLQHNYLKNPSKVGRLVTTDLALMDITI